MDAYVSADDRHGVRKAIAYTELLELLISRYLETEVQSKIVFSNVGFSKWYIYIIQCIWRQQQKKFSIKPTLLKAKTNYFSIIVNNRSASNRLS